MLSKLNRRIGRPSPAFALSVIALFVALGGTSYVVVKNSIGTKEVRNNSLRSADIRNGQVRSKDVGNGSLLARDMKAGQLPRGPIGPRGIQGVPGKNGTAGAPGAVGLERVVASSPNNSQSGKDATASCPAGKRVIGTAGSLTGEASGDFPNQIQDVLISDIVPSANLKFVTVRGHEVHATAASWQVRAFAICANVG